MERLLKLTQTRIKTLTRSSMSRGIKTKANLIFKTVSINFSVNDMYKGASEGKSVNPKVYSVNEQVQREALKSYYKQ